MSTDPSLDLPEEGDELEDEYDYYNWEPSCACWCEICGCHGDCMDDDEYDYDELDD